MVYNFSIGGKLYNTGGVTRPELVLALMLAFENELLHGLMCLVDLP